MNLKNRYKKLTLWNKIAVWGSIASFVGITLTIIFSTCISTENVNSFNISSNNKTNNNNIDTQNNYFIQDSNNTTNNNSDFEFSGEKNNAISKNQDSLKNDLKKVIKSQHDYKKTIPKQQDIKIDNSPNSVVQINETGPNIINQIKEEYKPKMIFLDKQVEFLQDKATGKIRTKFYFGSDKGFPLVNPNVHIYFDKAFESASGGVTGAGMVSSGNLYRKTSSDNKEYTISTDILQAGNYFVIEIVSKEKLEIIDLKVNPIDLKVNP